MKYLSISKCNGILRSLLLLVLFQGMLVYSSYSQVFIDFQTLSPDLPVLTSRSIQNSNNSFLHISNSNTKDDVIIDLHLTIEGQGINIQTNNTFGRPPIYLKAASQRMLFAFDLAAYFDANSLVFSGITREAYFSGGLPEGIYTVCFEAIDVKSGRSYSSKSCIQLTHSKKLPPKWISPDKSQFGNDIESIDFSWLPQSISTGVSNAEYTFKIYKKDESLTLRELLLYQNPVFETRTFGLSYTYDFSSNDLRTDQEYIAFVEINNEDRLNYVNYGVSKPLTFKLIEDKHSDPGELNEEVVSGDEKYCDYPPIDVFINEVGFDETGNTAEFIELVVVGSDNASEFVDLEGYIIDEFNDEKSDINNERGYIELGSCFNEIPKGSVILIYNDSKKHSAIDPASDKLSNDESKKLYQIPYSDPCIIKRELHEFQPDYVTGIEDQTLSKEDVRWAELISFDGPVEGVQILNDKKKIEHSIFWTEHQKPLRTRKSNATTAIDHGKRNESGSIGLVDKNWNSRFDFDGFDHQSTTPGKANNEANQLLIQSITGKQQTNRSENFHIVSIDTLISGYRGVVIEIFGSRIKSFFKILLNGQYYTITSKNTITIEKIGGGEHLIEVFDLRYGCYASCVLVEKEGDGNQYHYSIAGCGVGDPCDDGDPCTINDEFDASCECIGQPKATIIFNDSIRQEPIYNCLVNVTPDVIDTLYTSGHIHSLTLNIENTGEVVLDHTDNYNPSNEKVFHFPYFVENYETDQEWVSSELSLLESDLNNWLQENNYGSTIQLLPNDTIAEIAGSGTDVEFIEYRFQSNLNDLAIVSFQCSITPGPNQQTVYNVEVTGGCDSIVSYQWSSGSDLPYVVIDSADSSCYSVEVMCSDGCVYTGTVSGNGVNCNCIVGAPCVIDTSNLCVYTQGYYDSNCNCIVENKPDTDLDGVCDEIDMCPGYDDNIDYDNDGVPFGCDLCLDYDDNMLTQSEIDSLTDTIPSNDPSFCSDCPSGKEVEIIVEAGSDSCDYCLDIHDTLVYGKYLKGLTYINNHGEIESYKYIEGEVGYDDLIDFEGFENGTGDWNLFGGAQRITPIGGFRMTGDAWIIMYTLQGGESAIESNSFNYNNSCPIEFNFDVKVSPDADFVVEYKENSSSYTTVKYYDVGVDITDTAKVSVSHTIQPNHSSGNISFRIREVVDNVEGAIHIDDIEIKHSCGYLVIDSTTINSHILELLRNHLGEGVTLTYGDNPECPSDFGPTILIENATKEVQVEAIDTSGAVSVISSVSDECGNFLPGQGILKAHIEGCENASFEWSTGQTGPQIFVEDISAGYSVEVTCDSCVYTDTVGDENCIVGTPCTYEHESGDTTCYPGFIAPTCECVVDTNRIGTPEFPDSDNDGIPDECDDCPDYHNELDLDQNGIPDCYEMTVCPCNEGPSIVYTPNVINRYEHVVYLSDTGIIELVNGEIEYTSPQANYNLAYFLNELPMCFSMPGYGACGSGSSFFAFANEFKSFSISNGYEVDRVYIDSRINPVTNSEVYTLVIETNGEVITGANSDLEFWLNGSPFNRPLESSIIGVDTLSYTVSLDMGDCAICDTSTVSYLWSDGSTNSLPNIVELQNDHAKYSVTVSCGSECEYIIEGQGSCIIGAECNDYNPCTEEGRIDIDCNCVGEIEDETEDSDGDGIPDYCDECPDYHNDFDNDLDGVPNGCDICEGYDDYLIEEGYLDIDSLDCQVPCSFDTTYFYSGNAELADYRSCFLKGFEFYDVDSSIVYIDFTKFPGEFKSIYCIDTNFCDTGYTIETFIEDLNSWYSKYYSNSNLNHEFIYESRSGLSYDSLIISLKSLTVCCEIQSFNNGFPCFDSQITFSSEIDGLVEIGAICDDGDECTINDRFNENCQCKGVFLDSDNDGICDSLDLCNGPDHFDIDNDRIPDGCDDDWVLECEPDEISYCEYLELLLNNTGFVKESQLNNNTSPSIIHWDIANQCTRYKQLIDDPEFDASTFPFPDLVFQLKNITEFDNDNDGIIDYLDIDDVVSSYLDEQTLNYLCEKLGDPTVDNVRLSMLFQLAFQTVNYINRPGSSCYVSTRSTVYTPGCAEILGVSVYEDEHCVLRDEITDCEVVFFINCNGNCDVKYYGITGPNGKCGEVGTEVGTPCTEENFPEIFAECEDATDSCTVRQVVSNEDYDPENYDSGIPPCKCEIVAVLDKDGDGVCDIDDKCPEVDDKLDSDSDGLPDCMDDCPNFPGSIGDYCDDGDPCTWGDRIFANVNGDTCGCVGIIIDEDLDGVPECDSCDAAIDYDGDGYVDYVEMIDGKPICDVCPGLNDTVDVNGDNIPDCILAPHNKLGCPDTFNLIQYGLVLTYNSTGIDRNDLPEPIDLYISNAESGNYVVERVEYLKISNIRELSDKTEVFYEYPLFNFTLPDTVDFAAIIFSDHQQCVLSHTENDLAPVNCPGEVLFIPSEDRIQMKFVFTEEKPIDIIQLAGEYQFDIMSGSNIFNENIEVDLTEVVGNETINEITVHISGVESIPSDMTGFSGTITLPNGIVCSYNSGSIEANCIDSEGNSYVEGNPCDDGDPCTHHDKWLTNGNGICECVGTASPDTDGDGICDAIDECDKYNIDNNYNNIPDSCECEPPQIESVEVLGYDQVKVTLVEDGRDEPVELSITYGYSPEEVVFLTESSYTFKGLAAGLTYTVAARYDCSDIVSQEVQINETSGNTHMFCGSEIPRNTENVLRKLKLIPGDTIYAADFEVIIDRVSGSGVFSGKGHMKPAFFNLAQVNVHFHNVTVSQKNELLSGEIIVSGFGLDIISDEFADFLTKWADGLANLSDYLGELADGLQQVRSLLSALEDLETYINIWNNALGDFESIIQNHPFLSSEAKNDYTNAKQCMDDAAANGDTTAFENCKDLIIAAIDAINAELEALYKNAPTQVQFEASSNQVYGFDKMGDNSIKGYMPVIEGIADGPDYQIAWKSMASPSSGSTLNDEIGVNIGPYSIPEYELVFKDLKGNTYNESGGILTIPYNLAPEHNRIREIYAVFKHNTTEEITLGGKFNLNGYEIKDINIKVIPLTSDEVALLSTDFNTNDIIDKVGNIFNQAVVASNISIEPSMEYVPSFELKVEENLGLSSYSSSMKDVIREYKNSNTLDANTFYIFAVESSDATQPDLLGFMPKNKGFGFIVLENHGTSSQDVGRTIAHEICHGAYTLNHTWDDYPDELPKTETSIDNLMAYNGGSHLFKYQWDLIREPRMYIGLFDENSSSQSEKTFSGLEQLKRFLYLHDIVETSIPFEYSSVVCWKCIDGVPVESKFGLTLDDSFYGCTFANVIDQSNGGSGNIYEYFYSNEINIYDEISQRDYYFDDIIQYVGTDLPEESPESFVLNLFESNSEHYLTYCTANESYGDFHGCYFNESLTGVQDFFTALTIDFNNCNPHGQIGNIDYTILDNLMSETITGGYNKSQNIQAHLQGFHDYSLQNDINGITYFFDKETGTLWISSKEGVYEITDKEEQQQKLMQLGDDKFPGHGTIQEPEFVTICDYDNGSLSIKSIVNPSLIEAHPNIAGSILFLPDFGASIIEDIFDSKYQSIISEQGDFNGNFYQKEQSPIISTGYQIHNLDGEFSAASAGFLKYTAFAFQEVAILLQDLELSEPLWNDVDQIAYNKKLIHVYSPFAGILDYSFEELKDAKELLILGKQFINEPRETAKGIAHAFGSISRDDIERIFWGDIQDAIPDTKVGHYHRGRLLGKATYIVVKVVYAGGPLAFLVQMGKEGSDLLLKIRKIHEKVNSLAFSDKFNALNVNVREQFVKDFHKNIDEVKDAFKNRPSLLDAFDFVKGHSKIRKHIPTLEKIADLLEDQDFLNKLPNGPEDLKEILQAVHNPLVDGTNSKLVKLADHLENLREVVKNHSGADGFYTKLLPELKKRHWTFQDGIAHMLNDIKGFTSGSISKFDYEFLGNGVKCKKCRFDVELISGPPLFKEYKSWSLNGISRISTNQLVEYFRAVDKMADFEYVFNKLKTDNITLVKDKMKIVLSKAAPDIFDAMSSNLKNELGVSTLMDLENLIDIGDPVLYSFIKVK